MTSGVRTGSRAWSSAGSSAAARSAFPTANLETQAHTAIPADGVYAGWLASLDSAGAETERWPAAISVGTNPTFDGRERTVEAYALDRDDLDLYGTCTWRWISSTAAAGELKFDSVEELVAQMRRRTLTTVRRVLTAG